MNARARSHPVLEVYRRLLDAYGAQDWWPGDSPFEIIVGAILTQATSWTNVDKALDNLKGGGLLSPEALRDIPIDDLALIIRPSGYFNVKARRLKAFIDYLWEAHDGDIEAMLASDGVALRKQLLAINGIGEETADDILLYAANRPFFVIDAYTRRIMERVGVGEGIRLRSYTDWQRLFHDALPSDVDIFNQYHALLVQHGKDICRPTPICDECCLREMCGYP